MTLRERIADWISGGSLSQLRARLEIDHYWVIRNGALVREEGDPGVDGIDCRDATIEMLDEILEERLAQRDEAIARAEVAEAKLSAVGPTLEACLQAILTARNITEARKIAKQALGEGE